MQNENDTLRDAVHQKKELHTKIQSTIEQVVKQTTEYLNRSNQGRIALKKRGRQVLLGEPTAPSKPKKTSSIT